MHINQVWAAYFSGTDTTKTIVTTIAQEIAQACLEYLADYYAPDWNPWEKGRWSDG